MKTAISVNNEEEYDKLMEYLDKKGWKWSLSTIKEALKKHLG